MKNVNRRQFNKLLGASAVAVPVGMLTASLPSQAASHAAAPLVDPEDAQAKALQYMEVSDKDDANCAGCALYVAGDSEEIGACAVFPGASVAAAAWCSAYVAKPS